MFWVLLKKGNTWSVENGSKDIKAKDYIYNTSASASTLSPRLCLSPPAGLEERKNEMMMIDELFVLVVVAVLVVAAVVAAVVVLDWGARGS